MIRVAIMAQGRQTRLPELTVPKQLLWLNLCQETILGRTLRLLRSDRAVNDILVVGDTPIAHQIVPEGGEIETILPFETRPEKAEAWLETMPTDRKGTVRIDYETNHQRVTRRVQVLTLEEPGNSILRGLQAIRPWLLRGTHEHTVILLGDVIFSRACLDGLLGLDAPPDDFYRQVNWAVTRNLSASFGEVFGMTYARSHRLELVHELDHVTHPPFEAYQPGQLRRLLWVWQQRLFRNRGVLHYPDPRCCTFIDDYTKDIDTPDDLKRLGELDAAAYADDRERRAPFDGATMTIQNGGES